MHTRWFGFFVGLLFCAELQAFPCYITVVKDSCWANYNVTVDVLDAEEAKKLTSIKAPLGKSWGREKFECQPGQMLEFRASFTPTFWKGDDARTYPARMNWQLPEKIKKEEAAWTLTICYPRQFAEVPFPPDTGGDCRCETENIPPVKPE